MSYMPNLPALFFGFIPRVRPRLCPSNRPCILTVPAFACSMSDFWLPGSTSKLAVPQWSLPACYSSPRNYRSSDYLRFGLTVRIYSCEQFTVLIKTPTGILWVFCFCVLCRKLVTMIMYIHRFVGQLPFCWLVPELQHPAAGRGLWPAVRGRQRSSLRAQHHQRLHSRRHQSESADGFPP